MVRIRIAPSPTGEDLHVGTLHTALFNYAFARKNDGKFIVRIEDTDRTRLVMGAEEKFLKTLRDYGLEYDEGPDKKGEFGPYRQSERLDLYKKYIDQLLNKRAVYKCYCSRERLDEVRKKQQSEGRVPKYDRHCRETNEDKDEPFVVRLKVPDDKEIIFKDVIRGEIKFNSNDIDDQVLLKSDGYPTYHLAVVVDDYLMKISHVIRGEEWISSTPKHILLYEAFGWKEPVFAHTPLLRNPDKSKLSKRKNPVWASWYLQQGYLSEAILNFLALMGWSHPEEKEIFNLQEFIEVVKLEDIQPVGPVFDVKKLEWMNGEYIRKTQASILKVQIYDFYNKKLPENIIEKTIPLIQERIKKLSDYFPLCRFFFEAPYEYELDLSNKKDLLENIVEKLSELDEWESEKIGEQMQNLAEKEKIKAGDFFMILRVAITGKKISPPLNESMEILGKEESLARIKSVLLGRGD